MWSHYSRYGIKLGTVGEKVRRAVSGVKGMCQCRKEKRAGMSIVCNVHREHAGKRDSG